MDFRRERPRAGRHAPELPRARRDEPVPHRRHERPGGRARVADRERPRRLQRVHQRRAGRRRDPEARLHPRPQDEVRVHVGRDGPREEGGGRGQRRHRDRFDRLVERQGRRLHRAQERVLGRAGADVCGRHAADGRDGRVVAGGRRRAAPPGWDLRRRGVRRAAPGRAGRMDGRRPQRRVHGRGAAAEGRGRLFPRRPGAGARRGVCVAGRDGRGGECPLRYRRQDAHLCAGRGADARAGRNARRRFRPERGGGAGLRGDGGGGRDADDPSRRDAERRQRRARARQRRPGGFRLPREPARTQGRGRAARLHVRRHGRGDVSPRVHVLRLPLRVADGDGAGDAEVAPLDPRHVDHAGDGARHADDGRAGRQPAHPQHPLGAVFQLPLRADRLPAAQRAAGLDGGYAGLRAGGVPQRGRLRVPRQVHARHGGHAARERLVHERRAGRDVR